MRARVRVGGIRPGVVFLPFLFGCWDTDDPAAPDGGGRAANELTTTDWDAVSKQPLSKTAAARLSKVDDAGGAVAPAPTTTASWPVSRDVPSTRGGTEVEEVLP